ncbi:MAG: transglutaminase-like domain-containing protein [Pseudomonadota bacterium]
MDTEFCKNYNSLEELLLDPSPPFELAALLIARDAYPQLSITEYMRQLDELAAPLRGQGIASADPQHQAELIAHYLHNDLGFCSDNKNSFDTGGCYLNEVLDRRIGNPIMLSTIWIAIGRRLDVKIVGLGLPGYFLVRVGDIEPQHVDPSQNGKLLTIEDVNEICSPFGGTRTRLSVESLAPASTREMTIRLLLILKELCRKEPNHSRGLFVCDNLFIMTEDIAIRRDRGFHALNLRAGNLALEDFRAYVKKRPFASDTGAIKNIIEQLEHKGLASPQ